MSARKKPFPVWFPLLFSALLFSGCTTLDIGHAGYANDTVSFTVTNTGEPSGVFVQVTVYEIKNNRQEETGVFSAPLSLQEGENTALVSGTLKPGQYKLYIYLIQNGERKAAAIRDIVVN
jgi:hypothetical protein